MLSPIEISDTMPAMIQESMVQKSMIQESVVQQSGPQQTLLPSFLYRPIPPSTTRIILVRHGRSTFNDQQRYQGCSDEAVLNEQGWHHARQLGQVLNAVSIDAIYASPLQRVQQTVEGIITGMTLLPSGASASLSRQRTAAPSRSPQSLPHYSSALLQEIHLPGWEGRPYQEVRDQEATAYRCWLQHPHGFQTQDTYPVLDLYQRAHTFWQTVLPHHAGETLLVVSHGGTNHALISTALGLSPRYHHRLQQSNGGISVLDYVLDYSHAHFHPRATARLQALNLTQPLGETLPKLKAGKRGVRLLLLAIAPHHPPHAIPVEAIAQRLRGLPIAYSLTQTGTIPPDLAHRLLAHRSGVVQLQVQHDEFVTKWQRALGQARHATGLTTGLAIAPPDTIQAMIAGTIGLSSPSLDCISVSPGTLSVLHYPAGDHPPVLQAMNHDLSCISTS